MPEQILACAPPGTLGTMSANPSHQPRPDRLALGLLAAVLALLAWSVIHPHDLETWALEVAPAVGGIIILAATYRRAPLTPLLYTLIALHMALLIVGGHYTYAEVPLGNWAKEAFHLSRNHYDRLGHFMQGFVPAVIAREVLIRSEVLKRRGLWLAFIVLCVCMAISACYELVEWLVAELDSAGSQSFLGTQGDIWDTQEDMACCLVGALTAILTLSRWHDRQLRRWARA
jgi:putative membrane protein